MNWIGRHRRSALALICLFWTAAVLLALVYPRLPFLAVIPRSEQTFEDVLRREGRKTPERKDFAFLGIDQQSLQFDVVGPEEIAANRAFQLLKQGYPWSRELWALLLDRLFEAGARLVVFDMIFSPPNDGDQAFAAALDRFREKVVIGMNFDEAKGILMVPNSILISPPPEADDRVGLVNFWSDPADGKVRAAQFAITERQLAGMAPVPNDTFYYSLDARAALKLGEGVHLPTDFGPRLFRFGPANAYPPRSLWEIFDERVWRANYAAGAFFKNKVVMIGASAQIQHDFVNTPIGASTYGPALHLHALAAASAGEFLATAPPWLDFTSIALAGLAAWILIAFVRRLVIDLVALIGVTIGYLVLVRLLYDADGLILMSVPVLVAFLASGISCLGWDYVLERREKLKTRRTLERYVSKDLVKEILDNPASFLSTMKGARVPVTVLFSDLIGFTTLSERADPEELVRHLNEYLSKMVEVVFANNGTLDKFIGDAIMAVWGNVQRGGPAADAKACAHAALGMRKALKELNAGWRQQNRMNLGMGVGLNHGEAIAGNIGSGDRADLTVIGDAVNLASRLEALTRNYGVDILVGDAAADLIRGDFYLRSVARVQVKGKTVPVGVSTLLCAKGDEFDAELLKWLESYEEGIVKFRGRGFSEAKILFQRFLEFYPQDYLAKMYLDRAVEYELEPPEELWNAAEIFTKK